MQVLLDGQPLTVADPTLAGAVAAARTAAEARGRVIVNALGDGAPLPAGALDNPADAPTFSSMEFTSADPIALVSVSLFDGADALRQAKSTHDACSEAIQAGRSAEGMDHLREALQTWTAVRDLVEQSARLLSLDLSGYVAPGVHGEVSFDHAVSRFAQTLKSVQDSIQRQDWSELSDLIAYDMNALADQWIGLLESLSSHVKRVGRTRGGRE